MWIVVVVEPYYPTVKHFADEVKAREFYETVLDSGFVTHLAEVKENTINQDYLSFQCGKKDVNMKDLDVDWL